MYRRIFFIFMLFFSTPLWADSDAFVVRHIEVEGLHRISYNTVIAAMPLHAGQTYNQEIGNTVIAALFRTGFFSDVQLIRKENTLVVEVTERPTIDSITITGNKSIKTEDLKPVLKKMGITVGNTFDASQLHTIVVGLQQQYAMLGRGSAVITPNVKPLPRNRVAIKITIEEGKATVVRSITFTGNHAFSSSTLRDQMQLTTPSILTWFNHHDRYSETQLEIDLQNIQSFYLNRGFLDYRVTSQEVTPVTKGVAIRISVYEGPVYRISGYQLVADDDHLPLKFRPEIEKYLKELKVGSVFSRDQIMQINQEIADYFANNGYGFPLINPIPEINHEMHQVFLKYTIESGNRVYVRNIRIVGNTRTDGEVVRTQLRQLEGAPYSLRDVNESKRLIQNLGYLDQVEVTTKPVKGKNNQVDLTYHVHEVSSGRATLQAGYSDLDGFLYGANISEPNFLGSGRFVSLGFTSSAYTSNYGVSYNNPFYTPSGVSRGFSVNYSHTTPGNVSLEPYTMDTFASSMTYGIPISEHDRLSAGLEFDHIAISNVNPALVSPSVVEFTTLHASPYNQIKASWSYVHATLDRAIFPNEGNQQTLGFTLGVPVWQSSLSYYEATYGAQWYIPLFYGFILDPHMSLGYGNGYGSTDELPFYNNFYAGGIQTLPGFEANTLGPKNPNNLTEALGGNLQLIGGLNLILPNFISPKVRIAALLGAGNIFQTDHVSGISYENVSLDNLRVTTGIMVSWWSPLGAPIDFSLATPLNKKPGDQVAIFDFSFGAIL